MCGRRRLQGRCLRNAHLDRWYGREFELMQNIEVESARYMAAREQRDYGIAAVIAGEAVGLVHEILPAQQVVEQTVSEAARLIKNHGAALRDETWPEEGPQPVDL
jgi:nitronate monooxygenase